MREHLQPQQSDKHVQYGQHEGPRCQEEEEKELGKNQEPDYNSYVVIYAVCQVSFAF